MTMKSARLLSMACAVALAAGGITASAAATAAPALAAGPDAVHITPNPASAAEPFEGWGTSLVWFANATGNYPDDVRQKLFDAVFGDDGLNLNIARYNVGGGNASDVPSYLRPGGAVPGFWNPDLPATDAQGEITSDFADRARYKAAWNPDDPTHYDFDADSAQRWWLDALKDKVTHWEAFSNSPPYFLTQSGYVSGGINNATSEQLAPADMDKFAGYLVTVVDELEKEHGIRFGTIDPFNEPNTNYWQTQIPNGAQWPTGGRQEGAHIGPQAQDAMVKALAARLAQPTTTTDAVISAMDETNPGIFATNWNAWSAPSKGLVDQLNVHTYGTSGRQVVRDIAKAADKPLWMSEVEGNWTDQSRGFVTNDIENGLGMAQHIVGDLRELEPTAWVFWQPVEDLYNMEKVEKLNWGSVFIDFDCNAEGKSLRRIADGDADPSCQVLTNEKFNTVRNFTHYIHPGDRLMSTDNAQSTAAVDADGDGATIVHVNSEATERTVEIDLRDFGAIAPGATVTPIVTTQSTADQPSVNALKEGTKVAVNPVSRTATLTVPAKSVTTFVIDGVSGVSEDAAAFRDGDTVQLTGLQSGLALDGSGASPVLQRTAATTDAIRPQTWTVRTVSGAGTNLHRFTLQNGDGRFLASRDGGTALLDSDPTAAAADPALQWMASTTDGTYYSVLNVASERVLDVNGQSTTPGASVGLYTSNGGYNQLWRIGSTRIVGTEPVSVATAVGVEPELPGQATVRYAGRELRSAAVEWQLDGQDWSRPGTVQVRGTGTDIFGATFEATASVEVGAFSATRPASATVPAGSALETVKGLAGGDVQAEVRPSGAGYWVPVEWTWDGLTDAAFAETGTVTVPGVATGPSGERLDATLTVIVTAASERNVAPQSSPSATFTESGYPVSNTINGSATDKGWSNWKGGTKNEQDTLSYSLAQRETLTHVAVQFYRDGSSFSWPATMRVDHRMRGGEWTLGETLTVPTPSSGAPRVDVPVTGSADEVRVVMNARSQTHMIVSEVEIFAAAPAPAGIADLARLTVGDQVVDGFAPDQLAYTVASTGAAWPALHALAVDTGASVVVTQPGDADGVGSVTVTAPDGTVRTYTVTVARAVGVAAPTIAGEPRVGATVRASAVTDPADATVTWVWMRDGAPIPDATGDAYALTAVDAGRSITVEATAAADGFTAGSARSASIVPAAPPVEPGPGGGGDGGDGSGGPTPDGGAGNPVTGGGSSASGSGAGESSSASGRDLARTGRDADGAIAMAWGAFGLLVLGVGALLVRRRRSDV
ncbi:glycoside hydrolase [Microbacterium sp. 1P10AE]|uniref:glycoside hydrolase n=1 Tax=Microbacterium sp. 1P10AE TaxID=3132286 RepID=UPI00399F2425